MTFSLLRTAPLRVLLLAAAGACGADETESKASPELLPPLSAKELKQLSGDLLPESLKPKIAILDATVSLDGVARPDLGVAFADTIAAKLLKSDDFEILDSSSAGPVGLLPLPGADPARLATPGPSVAVEVGKAVGADFVVVPTIIGQEGEFRVTMRKLRVPGGKIDEIIQETVTGSVKTLFSHLEQAAGRLLPERKTENAPITYVKVWMTPPSPPPAPLTPEVRLATEIAGAPKALRPAGNFRGTGQAATAAPEPVKVGRIDVVNQQWSFCEFACVPGVTLQPRQQVFAWSGGDMNKLVSMTVSRIEGGRIIADLPRNSANGEGLRSGDFVYRWATPTSAPAQAAR